MPDSPATENVEGAMHFYGEELPQLMYYEDDDFGKDIASQFHQETSIPTAVCSKPKMPAEVFITDVRLYLVDIRFQDTDSGLRVIRELAKRKRTKKSIVIIAISAYDKKEAALHAGADIFIDKSDAGAVIERLKAEFHQMEDQTQPPPPSVTYEGVVLEVGTTRATVELNIDGNWVQRVFPIGQLECAGAATVGTPIIYSIQTRGNEVSSRINAVEASEDESWKRALMKRIEREL